MQQQQHQQWIMKMKALNVHQCCFEFFFSPEINRFWMWVDFEFKSINKWGMINKGARACTPMFARERHKILTFSWIIIQCSSHVLLCVRVRNHLWIFRVSWCSLFFDSLPLLFFSMFFSELMVLGQLFLLAKELLNKFVLVIKIEK